MTGYKSKKAAAQDKLELVDYEKLAALGWQAIECPFCGSSGAQAFPKPPQRPWVGLTNEETSGFTQHEMAVVKYVSKVLQEKNT